MRALWLGTLVAAMTLPAPAEEPVKLAFTRAGLEAEWRARIESILDKGTIPLVDLLSFLPRESAESVLRTTREVMDEKGVALIAFAGYWAPKRAGDRGHRWDYFIHQVVNADPARFILATNKGGNTSWWSQKAGRPRDFIDQLEQQARSGDYALIGQVEFRHYPSNAQCRQSLTARDVDIPLDGPAGHRVFKLAADTRLPLSIHLEPEDRALDALARMLRAYPGANVIVSHFGQIRHPERQARFGPALVERLLAEYPNLHFDLATGEPGRYYTCGTHRVLDTVLWEDDGRGGQRATLKPEYRMLLSTFRTRFVAGFDFGPENRQSARYLREKIENVRLIMRDLPDGAKHAIGYGNGWRLLTGKAWR